MNEVVQVFESTDFGKVRTILIDGEPWFVGKDVAIALGYKDSVNALKLHVEIEDKAGWQITTQFGEKKTTIINESGLYALIFGSKLDTAKEFKYWVTHDVLPTIRKTGSYQLDSKAPVVQAQKTVTLAIEDAQSAAEVLAKSIAGLKPEMALAAAMASCGKFYGVDTVPFQRLLPAEVNHGSMKPTELARRMGIYYKNGNPNPRAVNKQLEALGLQIKNEKGWELTTEGTKYGEVHIFSSRNANHSGYEIMWKEETLNLLQKAPLPA